ncbi:MAG: diguanylate cyclase [Planctomycetes bacterium]|nr:diguanylate cyclase [Planctomycetota bacterium]
MNLTLLLPWFPIILAVGVAGRLLGKTRGIGIGIACALFWIVLAQAGSNHAVWTDPWIVVSLITGSLAIIAMGAWSADVALDGTPTAVNSTPTTSANAPRTAATTSAPDPRDGAPPEDLDWAFDQFNDWLETHRHDRNPWPAFDGFLRSVLNRCCGATHVKPYRVLTDSDELVPLTDADSLGNPPALSARGGILGHVSTTGRSFLADDPGHGEFVDRLARASSDPPAWCFAVRSGTCRIGVVTVGRLDIAPEHHRAVLRTAEGLVNLWWALVAEACRCRETEIVDPASGVLTRDAFLAASETTLRESYALGEPVAMAAVALEHLRELNDTGRWDLANELVREVCGEIRRKLRLDDCVGRFDGSRFLLLLRRVDSELASLIVSQLMRQLTDLCADEQRWGVSVVVRCGVVGSGNGQPGVRDLITRAIECCHDARRDNIVIASDLGSPSVSAEAVV